MNFFQTKQNFSPAPWSTPFLTMDKLKSMGNTWISSGGSKDTLSSMWVDINNVKNSVQRDIQSKKEKNIPKTKVIELINNAPEWVNPEDIIESLLSKWYTLEGFDADKFKTSRWSSNQAIKASGTRSKINLWEPTAEIEPVMSWSDSNNWSALKNFFAWAKKKSVNAAAAFKSWMDNLVGGAVSQIPAAAWNTAWFLSDVWEKITPFNNSDGETWDKLRALWQAWKDAIQDFWQIDEESFATKTWEFWANVGLLFVPGGQSKLLASFPWSAEKIGKLWSALDDLAKKSPKVYEKLKSIASAKSTKLAWQWAKETAKFEVFSEWEISPTSVAIWAVANPVISKAWQGLKNIINDDIASNMNKIFKPSAAKWKTHVSIKADMNQIANTMKTYSLKPKSREELYTWLKWVQKSIYNDSISPIFKAGTANWGTINTSSVIDSIIDKVWENKKIWNKSIANIFWKTDEVNEFNTVVENIRKLWDLDFMEAENLKQYTSALVMAAKSNKWTLSSIQEDFIIKLNKWLWDTMDEMLESITWESVKSLKSEYGAIARHIDSLNRSIIAENRRSGDSLFSGLGKISGIRDIVSWNPMQWISTILTGSALKLMKDPDEILKKVVRELYNEAPTGTTVSEGLIKLWKGSLASPKIRGGASSEAWQSLDDNQ